MITLANRTERVASDGNDYEAPYIRNSIAGNLGRLTSHILDAPEGVDDEIILAAEELVEKCQRIQEINNPSDSMVMFMDQEGFLQHARSVKQKSRTAKNNVGWL